MNCIRESGAHACALFWLSGWAAAQAALYDIPPKKVGEALGHEMSDAGDVDGDGRVDLVVSALERVRVFSGATGKLLWDIQDSKVGGSVSGIGDVDQDGYGDFMYGVPFLFQGGGTKGGVRVISGRTGLQLAFAPGVESGGQHGASITEVGDVNDDGVQDLVAGAPLADLDNDASGVAYVHSGATGVLLYSYASFDKDPRLGSNGFARHMDSVGDQDLDGVPDFIVAPVFTPGIAKVISGASGSLIRELSPSAGSSYYIGDVAGLGDVTGDGTSEICLGVPNTIARTSVDFYEGGTGLWLHGSDYVPGFAYGQHIAGRGDQNGDGWPDLVMTHFSPEVGAVLQPGAVRAVSGLDGSLIAEFLNTDPTNEFGISVANLGDVNGDGWGEFAVGAQRASYFLGDDSGLVRVFSSGTPQLTANQYTLPLAPGGAQQLRVKAGAQHAGDLYLLLGTTSSIYPGLALDSFQLPLNPDAYSTLALTPGATPLSEYLGLLDGAGKAIAVFHYPPGLPTSLASTVFDHSALFFDPVTFAITGTTNSVGLAWTQ